MKKILLLVCLLAATATQAQEKIDRMVESFSTIGQAHYKSLVIRDPETKAIVKIVKTIKIENVLMANDFCRAFKEESPNAIFKEEMHENGKNSIKLIFQKETRTCIYLLEIDKSQIQVQLIIAINSIDEK